MERPVMVTGASGGIGRARAKGGTSPLICARSGRALGAVPLFATWLR